MGGRYRNFFMTAWRYLPGRAQARRVGHCGSMPPVATCIRPRATCSAAPSKVYAINPWFAHYSPSAHALEVLAEFDTELWNTLCCPFPVHTFFIGLTSIHWREAWKYGQRAYRYCMHDAGHAMGAISMAAGGLGWQTRLLDDLGTDELALLMGTFRDHDAEREEPDMLIACVPDKRASNETSLSEVSVLSFESLAWQGRPNQLSRSHVEWGIEDIASQVRKPRGECQYQRFENPPLSRSRQRVRFHCAELFASAVVPWSWTGRPACPVTRSIACLTEPWRSGGVSLSVHYPGNRIFTWH